MRKKIVAVFAAALMLFGTMGALTGCGNKEKTIEILLLANKQERTYYLEYFKEYEQTLKDEGLDYKINFVGLEEGDYYSRLNSAVQRKSVPDIFYVRPNEIYRYKNLITPLQDFADTYGKGDAESFANLSNIYETALDMYRYNVTTGELGNPSDPLYAFPKDLSVQQLGYYRPLLEQFETQIHAAHYEMPWELATKGETYTWDEYAAICKIIADNIGDGRYACDVPSIEILAKSYAVHETPNDPDAGTLIDMTGGRANAKVNDITTGAIAQAIEYQATLVDAGAHHDDGYSNFTAKKLCFYSLVGSWEVQEYTRYLGNDWGVMPWPTVAKTDKWYGLITSAGYVVSKDAAGMAKGDIAKRIAMSFMSDFTQKQMVEDEKISLPLRKNVADDYINPENDSKYAPATRKVYLDVISGENGFFPAKYSTYDDEWFKVLTDKLAQMWNEGKGKAHKYFEDTDWTKVKNDMQNQYDVSKTR